MLHFIEKNSPINKFDLMDLCGMSVGEYNQLSSWFKYRYEETGQIVEYSPKTKSWRWIGRGSINQINDAMKVNKK